MTTWVPSLDASERLRAELRRDPRFTDDETPSPAFIERMRNTTRDIGRHAAQPEETR